MQMAFSAIKKVGRLLAGLPVEGGMPNGFFKHFGIVSKSSVESPVLAMQLVPDKLYFMLLGAISMRLKEITGCGIRLVVVRAVSGAIGTGGVAVLKRSAVAAWIFSRPWIRACGSLADGLAYRSADYWHPIEDWQDWRESKRLWQRVQLEGAGFSLRIGGIEIADLLVDSYLRFKPAPAFHAADPFVRRLIWQALRDLRRANHFFAIVKPRWYISSYSTYLEHGVAVRVALQHGVFVWTFGNFNQFGKRLSQADSYHTSDFSGYRAGFDVLDGKEERLLVARQMLETRLAGGIDTATSYMRKSAYGNKDAALPEGLDGAVVVFLHDFYDSPHVYPELVFQDFWSWICSTIEVFQQAGINFFLKPHPNQIALSEGVLADLRQKYPGLAWIAPDVSNVQLVQAGIACGVTVYGTVAHELAYLGVPSIGCARHPHHTFDFCRTARTREEYAVMLRTYRTMPLPVDEMQRQALTFFYMHNLFSTPGQLELRTAFAAFWKLCASADALQHELADALQGIMQLQAFNHFLESMLEAA
jgi:hypothetical protein